MASLNIAGVPTPPSNTSGFNRSRRSSWSDSKNAWNVGDEAEYYSDSHTLILKKLDIYYRKVEIFKSEQSSTDALHSKFSVFDGSQIEGADEVGQLQICAVSIYLLMIVQMITSNLQQLIFSIERAYRTPDYGIWERGTKYNTNTCELHASSIGMAKAALESMNGFNLYGDQGSNWSVVNRTTFDTLLPRESASKNTDVALLLTVG
ncbi:unnamed protein product [Rotaria socialis]|uniref:Phosphorylase b kinase regulatory subunit n=1 Tax=Rotaria socialis TaxID=392032 RepID=A0A821BG10_9BILA|nr:unnamed protein product [Rotaria socialis]